MIISKQSLCTFSRLFINSIIRTTCKRKSKPQSHITLSKINRPTCSTPPSLCSASVPSPLPLPPAKRTSRPVLRLPSAAPRQKRQDVLSAHVRNVLRLLISNLEVLRSRGVIADNNEQFKGLMRTKASGSCPAGSDTYNTCSFDKQVGLVDVSLAAISTFCIPVTFLGLPQAFCTGAWPTQNFKT